jgi:hypothetical protein
MLSLVLLSRVSTIDIGQILRRCQCRADVAPSKKGGAFRAAHLKLD